MDAFEHGLGTALKHAVPSPPGELNPFEILDAARDTRRPLRWAAPLGSAVLVAAIVVTMLEFSGSSRSQGPTAVPATTQTTTTQTTTTQTTTAQQASDQIERQLWRIAVNAARSNHAQVAHAEAVHASSRAHAVAVTMGDGVAGDHPVWVVQVQTRHQFTCLSCSGPAGSTVRGRYIIIVLDAKTLRGSDDAITRQPANLAKLGRVIRLRP